MLKQLYIKNFALIDELDIEFRPGFSVITGETGAGKSIILGAIGLLLGQRADSKTIKQGADRCIIEAHFDLSRYDLQPFFNDNDIDYDASDCIIRRELTSAGKSRAFVNDTPVALALLKELGDMLVDVHSQHQNLLLAKQDFQLEVVDTLAKDQEALAEKPHCMKHRLILLPTNKVPSLCYVNPLLPSVLYPKFILLLTNGQNVWRVVISSSRILLKMLTVNWIVSTLTHKS